MNELVGELSVRSERFRQLWARHDARPKRSGTSLLDHPQVGPLQLSYEKLPIPDTNCLTLIYHAEPGTTSSKYSPFWPRPLPVSANRSGASQPTRGQQCPTPAVGAFTVDLDND